MSTVGVTMIAPSMSVPASRDSDRRSQPTGRAAGDEPGIREQLVAGAAAARRRALEELDGERLELGDQDADDVGALPAQAAGDE